ncbi:MAG TPA: tetratricopeptide repeat protein [Dehalococcoidia bacterium]|nr:tetratricopeptide repeat protein [Dehalococcoidia bacterium]
MSAVNRKDALRPAPDYFAILGLGEDASQDEIEARYQALSEHLASEAVPSSLREWAAVQATLLDEAYAVLADPDQRAALRSVRAAPAPAPVAEAAAASAPQAEAQPSRRDRAASAAAPAPLEPGLRIRLPLRPGTGRLLLGLVLGLAALGVFLLLRSGLPGGGGGGATPAADQSGQIVPLDTARVAELMATIQQDPNNAEALFELGESFFLATEWQPAIDWFTRLVAIDPNNVHARTDIGTANFNLGRSEEAKAAWAAALAIAPSDVQLHFNMGFLYANAEPRDLDGARKEWQTVLDLAPGSDLANTAQVHLDSLSAQPAAEATPAAP